MHGYNCGQKLEPTPPQRQSDAARTHGRRLHWERDWNRDSHRHIFLHAHTNSWGHRCSGCQVCKNLFCTHAHTRACHKVPRKQALGQGAGGCLCFTARALLGGPPLCID